MSSHPRRWGPAARSWDTDIRVHRLFSDITISRRKMLVIYASIIGVLIFAACWGGLSHGSVISNLYTNGFVFFSGFVFSFLASAVRKWFISNSEW